MPTLFASGRVTKRPNGCCVSCWKREKARALYECSHCHAPKCQHHIARSTPALLCSKCAYRGALLAPAHRPMHTTSTLRSPAIVPFLVTRKGREYDTVYFNPGMTSAEVRRSLIEHDGYPVDIEVRRDA